MSRTRSACCARAAKYVAPHAACHSFETGLSPGGAGPAPELAGPSNPAAGLTDQQIVDLVRTGEGHADPPGAFSEVDLREQQLIDILAFIREQSQ